MAFRADELSDNALLERLELRINRNNDSVQVGWGRANLRYAMAARLQGVYVARARRVEKYPEDAVTLAHIDAWITRAQEALRGR